MHADTEKTLGGPHGFWIVCGDPEGLRDPLVVDVPGVGGALAVFSFEQEARLFLSLADRDGLLPTRVSRAELLALLVGRWADLGSSVALDLVPGLDGAAPYTTTSRESFVRFLAARKGAGRGVRDRGATRGDVS
jgi:hypothetical protein